MKKSQAAKPAAELDDQAKADVDYMSTLLVKGISGLVELGISDGLKLKRALETVKKNDAAAVVMAQIWSKFWNMNPHAASAIELAAAMNPKLGEFLERMRMKSKEVPAGDATIKDAERI